MSFRHSIIRSPSIPASQSPSSSQSALKSPNEEFGRNLTRNLSKSVVLHTNNQHVNNERYDSNKVFSPRETFAVSGGNGGISSMLRLNSVEENKDSYTGHHAKFSRSQHFPIDSTASKPFLEHPVNRESTRYQNVEIKQQKSLRPRQPNLEGWQRTEATAKEDEAVQESALRKPSQLFKNSGRGKAKIDYGDDSKRTLQEPRSSEQPSEDTPTHSPRPVEEAELNTADRIPPEQNVWRPANLRFPKPLRMRDRFPKERRAMERNEDYSIFSLHSHYLRPLREFEWLNGEICRPRRNATEIPPGAEKYFISSNSLPATAFEPFVFANPPRHFFFHTIESSCRKDFPGTAQQLWKLNSDSVWRRGRRTGTSCYLDKEGSLALNQIQEMERMIWFDPEPRLERSYRLIASSKICSKGVKVANIKDLLRIGW